MKILQFVTQMEAAGSQSQALNLQEELNRRGHTVQTVFLYIKRPAFVGMPGVTSLFARPLKPWQVPLLFWRIFATILRARPDVVMPYSHWSNVIIGPIARLAGYKVAINQTQIPSREPRLARDLDRLWGALGIYHLNLTNSRTTMDEMTQKITPGYARRLRLIRLGVGSNLPPAESSHSADFFKKAFNLQYSPLLLHMGRLSIQKNHATLLKAMVTVNPKAHLACIGDGELRSELHALAESLGVSHRVHWLGEKSGADVSRLFAAADLFVFPSLWEGFGLAPVEAAAAGLPLIVSDINTFHEVMALPKTNTLAAELVDPNSPEQLAETINKVLASSALQKDLKARSAKLAAKYSIAAMADDYETCLKELF